MSKIDPRAVIEEGAQIGENVVIEPFAVVKSNVVLQSGVVIKSHAYIDGHTTIGENTVVYPGASIGTKTADRKFMGEKTYVTIGKNCEIREFATINSSCGEGSRVIVGDNCLVMAYCHVAHNCELGRNVIMTNNAALAGHVIVEECAIIGGMTPIHQNVRIGAYAMVGGMSRITEDVPPYTVGGGIPYKFGGINLIGLKRHNFALKTRQNLARCFKLVYRSGLYLEEALKAIESECEMLPEVRHWIDFCKNSKRGLMAHQGVAAQAEEEERELEALER